MGEREPTPLQPTTVQSSQPQGTIVAQSPAAGTPVKQGQTISVSVSAGPPEVNIPDVQGESCQQAQQDLSNAGFTNVTVQQGWFRQNRRQARARPVRRRRARQSP